MAILRPGRVWKWLRARVAQDRKSLVVRSRRNAVLAANPSAGHLPDLATWNQESPEVTDDLIQILPRSVPTAPGSSSRLRPGHVHGASCRSARRGLEKWTALRFRMERLLDKNGRGLGIGIRMPAVIIEACR